MAPCQHLSPLAPKEVGVSHEGLFCRVCWVLRAVTLFLLIAHPVANIAISSLGYSKGSMSEHVAVLSTGTTIAGFGLYGWAWDKPYTFEIGVHHVIACISFFTMSMQSIAIDAQLQLQDLIGMAVMRPLGSLVIMSTNTILEVAGSSVASDLLWATACLALNCSVVYRCYQDMPSLLPLVISAMADQGFVALLLKSTTAALLKERDAMKQVRDALQQNLNAQDSMWRSVFDATCLLNASGEVTRASPQALDLLQRELPESVVGSLLVTLAPEIERGRLDTFLKAALDNESNSAVTIQSTFTTGTGDLIDVQLNAVKVIQDMSNLSSSSVHGVLLGIRSLAAESCAGGSAEKSAAAQAVSADLGQADDSATARSTRPTASDDDAFVSFDAGQLGFPVIDCSPELWKMPEMLDWIPRGVRKDFEKWVLDEVDVCDEDGGTVSDVIENVKLKIQPRAVSVQARRAWVQTLPAEQNDDGSLSFPTVLRLQGVRVQKLLRHGTPTRESCNKKLTTVSEEDGNNDDPDGNDTASTMSDVAPSESASQVGLHFLVRATAAGKSTSLVSREDS